LPGQTIPLVSRARCSALRAASQNRDRTKHRRSLRPRLCSVLDARERAYSKCYALRCVRGMIPFYSRTPAAAATFASAWLSSWISYGFLKIWNPSDVLRSVSL
jgi:hypothetical protein